MPPKVAKHVSPLELRGSDDFNEVFPDDETCLEFLWQVFHSADGEHARCPRCAMTRTFRRYRSHPTRRSWTCTACGFHLHPTVGTVFERSGTPLRAWFYAIYLLAHDGEKISARRLQGELHVTYKTAWRILHVIRERTLGLQRLGDVFEPESRTA
jgi:transposase-like protein